MAKYYYKLAFFAMILFFNNLLATLWNLEELPVVKYKTSFPFPWLLLIFSVSSKNFARLAISFP